MPIHLTSALLLLLSALLLSCHSPSAPDRPATDFTLRKNITFTPAKWPAPLVADFYQPISNRPTPAVLLIHGGGWNDHERRSDMKGIAKQLAKRGYLVMNTTYRLTPTWQFPAQEQDIAQAIHYIRRNAKSLNIDPTRIATFGYSAGGHLAALAGFTPGNNIKAIIAGGAPTDLALWPDGRLTGLLLGGPLKGHEAIYRAASPISHITPHSPPTFIYHGTADTLVPTEPTNRPDGSITAAEMRAYFWNRSATSS